MGRYRKIDTRIWNDEKFVALSDSGKLAFLFLLTHPHMTSLGAMRGTMTGLAAELGWTPKAFREAFREAFRKGLVEHDESACFVALPNFLKYNGPESPNVVKSWSDALDLIPECSSKNALLQRVKGFAEGLSKAFAEALPEAFRKAMPNQEQEPEQEQEQEQEQESKKRTRSPAPPSVDEVREYCQQRGNAIDPEYFVSYYAARGWRFKGGDPVRDWKSCVHTWEKGDKRQQAKGIMDGVEF